MILALSEKDERPIIAGAFAPYSFSGFSTMQLTRNMGMLGVQLATAFRMHLRRWRSTIGKAKRAIQFVHKNELYESKRTEEMLIPVTVDLATVAGILPRRHASSANRSRGIRILQMRFSGGSERRGGRDLY